MGQDPVSSIDETLNRSNDFFIINTFGFGNQHDAELMRNIARRCGGNFYFVDDIIRIQDFFIDAISLLFSMIMKNIEILVNVCNEKTLPELEIIKTYGEMWRTRHKNNGRTIWSHFFSNGMTKDYICELNISKMPKGLSANEKNRLIMEITMIGLTISGKKVTKKARLMIFFAEKNEEMLKHEVNSEVIGNYLRVFGAEKLEQAKNYSDKKKFDLAQKMLNETMKKINECQWKDHPFLVVLKDNVEKALQFCKEKAYNNEKKAYVAIFSQNHMFQQSDPSGSSQVEDYDNVYSTNVQEYVSSKLGSTTCSSKKSSKKRR